MDNAQGLTSKKIIEYSCYVIGILLGVILVYFVNKGAALVITIIWLAIVITAIVINRKVKHKEVPLKRTERKFNNKQLFLISVMFILIIIIQYLFIFYVHSEYNTIFKEINFLTKITVTQSLVVITAFILVIVKYR